LKVRRPHQGIDYAAQRGTPVWSVGDGKVIFRGRSGGLGKLVKVRHGNGYVSYYGHLSRFADVRVGDQVGQKQVLGFVGCTGLCAGPHLDFRFKHYGKYVNPALVQTPPGDPISGGDLDRFAKIRERLLRELDPAPIAAMTSEAL
jgi:murein DD-endopeptidase MepM/ murein hydrolase activator NlpD